jgi:SAM-dependent methyltransferase
MIDETVAALRADYDATPYTSNSFPQSAPGNLAAIAHLFGLTAPRVSSARVIEIGCATGGNLAPFAAFHPRAQVVGVDLSPVQIDLARERMRALGLDNVELIAGDIAELDLAALGTFDFVIAHGVYSWVPADVQEALLAAVRTLLAPDGIGYLSYNVYPGWKTKEVVRDAMLLASGGVADPQAKVREARGIAEFLEDVVPPDGVLARVLAEHRAFNTGYGDSFLLHEELETFNAPCYFYEFLGRAGAHGLTYLAEARPQTMFGGYYGPKVADFLQQKAGGVQVLAEQYLDFVSNRMFRETLVVHSDRAGQIQYTPARRRYEAMHVAATLPPAGEPTAIDFTHQEYEQVGGETLFTNDPGIKAALDALTAAYPWTMSRDELVEAVHARLAGAGLQPSDTLPQHMDDLIGTLILQGQCDFRLAPVAPRGDNALRLDDAVRRMAALEQSPGEASTFNAWHETVMLTPLDRHALALLDGTRDREALVAALLNAVRGEGENSAELAAMVTDYVDTLPQRLREMKLLRVG